MKTTLNILLLIAFCTTSLFAQDNQLQKEAEMKINQIPADLNVAKTNVDKDCNDPEKSKKPMSWFLKGYVYTEMAKSNVHRSKYGDVGQEALDALNKCIKLDQRRDLFPKVINVMFNLAPIFYNDGVTSYNAGLKSKINEDFKIALNNFEKFYKALEVLGEDDKVIKHLLEYSKIDLKMINVYAGYSAQQTGDRKKAKDYYSKVIHLEGNKSESKKKSIATAYIYQSQIYEAEGDSKTAMKIIKRGIELFPEDGNVINTAIQVYKNANEYEKLAEVLEIASKQNQSDLQLLSILGDTYKNLAGDFHSKGYEATAKDYREKAVKAYEKVLASGKADNKLKFVMNYNAGLLYYNPGVKLYQQKAELKRNEIDSLFTTAYPYFEEAHKADPRNKNVLNILINIFKVLHNSTKGLYYEEKLNKL